jgi:hypothetical protein
MDILHPDSFPPLPPDHGFLLSGISDDDKAHNNGSPYITASAACLAAREVQKAKEDKADDKRKWAANLEEVRPQKEQFATMEARLLSLSNPSPTEDHDMDDREEETAICQSFKKTTGNSSFSIPSAGYSSPTRISRSSNKQTQVSSPATHYAMSSQRPFTPSKETKTLQFFLPGGNAERRLAAAVALSQRLASHKTPPSKVIKIINDGVDDNDVDRHPGDFFGGKMDNGPKLGDDATGQSPMAPGQPPVDINPPPQPVTRYLSL